MGRDGGAIGTVDQTGRQTCELDGTSCFGWLWRHNDASVRGRDQQLSTLVSPLRLPGRSPCSSLVFRGSERAPAATGPGGKRHCKGTFRAGWSPGKEKSRRNSLLRRVLQCRGDRRQTFPNDSGGQRLLWLALSQTLDFEADSFVE